MSRATTIAPATTRDGAPRTRRAATPRRWQGQLARIVRARRSNGLQPPPPVNDRPLLPDGTPDPDAFIFERKKDWQRRWVAGWPGSGEQHGLHRAVAVLLVIMVILGLALVFGAVIGMLDLLGAMG